MAILLGVVDSQYSEARVVTPFTSEDDWMTAERENGAISSVSLTIVVGTSRCGSTMLSRMLGAHPEVVSISEFWNCFMETEGQIPTHEMSGEEFWQRLATPAPLYDGLVLAGIKKDEKVQPFPSRFNYAKGMPPICRILFWSTAKPPDQLYDSLAAEACSWGRQPMADHCRALFTALASRLGRRVVVERTGGSLTYVELLTQQFPEARFVFLHRDGPDVALSMARYPTTRLSALRELAAAVESGSPPDLEMVPEDLRSKKLEDFEGVIAPPYDKKRFIKFPLPLAYHSGIWSNLTRMGTREIRTVPRDRVMTLRYENLLKRTRSELSELADFIGIAAQDQWLDWASGFVNTKRAGSALAQLHPGDVAALRASCAVGNRAFDLLESELAS